MYNESTFLTDVKEFNELRKENSRYANALARYKKKTIKDFKDDYKSKGLKGKGVYDKLMLMLAPEEYKTEQEGLEVKVKVNLGKPERYSIEELMTFDKRILPYVSNIYQSVGKLMDSVISQAIEILKRSSSVVCLKYSDALKYFFLEHKSVEEIVTIIKDSKENIQGNMLRKFMRGGDYSGNIIISNDYKLQITKFMEALLYHSCNTTFEENDIDTPEKIKFASELSGYEILDNIKEWGNAIVLTKKSYTGITRQHLISLKKAICDAIVPVSLNTLIENTKADFIDKNNPNDFNQHIIESFVQSNPWIKTDDDGKFYILTKHLTSIYQKQGRIIYEAGGLIHHKEVKVRYESIYKESYNTSSIQSSLTKRNEHDFFPYGKTGLWYYSEDGIELKPANKVIAKFVDEHICFYWKDLADVVSQLCRVNKNFSKRRIRVEITNLCNVDTNDKDHFVKKGEEEKYPSFSWSRPKQNRTNWCVNHAYEMLKETPNGEMSWVVFEKQFKQDLLETGRPLKAVEDIKYKHSGTGKVFIRENDMIRINEDVIQNEYNGDLSMYGLYRKYHEYYNVIFSYAMTELRKQQDNKMLLVDFIALALKNIECEGDVKIDATYIRGIFDSNDNLPKGLSRYNENGSVYIKYDPVIVNEDTKDDLQYAVTTQPSDNVQDAPQLVVSAETRQPVTYTTRFNWNDVKKALKADLAFYDSPFWYQSITSDQVLDKFVRVLSSSKNYNLNDLVPQIIYEFHYARIDRYDHYQYLRNLPVAFEALLREIYESSHRPVKTNGIKALCENGFTEFDNALTYHDKKGFGRILNDLVQKRNLLLHGANLELSPVTLVQNIIEYIALFVYTVSKYALED
jgi:hypothetical protein